MEAQRKASEKRKMQVLRALNCLPDISAEKLSDLEKLEEEVIRAEQAQPSQGATLKDSVAVAAKLRKGPVNESVKRKRRTWMAEPTRRSARLSNVQPSYAGLDDFDDDEEKFDFRKGKRKRLAADGDWSGRQRSSQVSRGEVKPYVPMDNSYGPIDGIIVGTSWGTRLECSRDGVHRPTVAGIHAGPDGCYSVALSGGYPENEDCGDVFWYTGEGGRDLKGTKAKPKNLRTAPQSKDQTWTSGNTALYKSFEKGKPVRVIRGFSKNREYTSAWAPDTGYRYDGLYKVVEWKVDNGKTGFNVFRFKFERLPGQDPIK